MDAAAIQRAVSDPRLLAAASAAFWAQGLGLVFDGAPFHLRGHLYQLAPLTDPARVQVAKKGAQVGWTTITMIRVLHGLIHGHFPVGAFYLFPTQSDVTDFSKGRFGPLIKDNPAVAQHVQRTDAANIKRVSGAMLYLRGAKATGRIRGVKRTSSKLKSFPADIAVLDERDEMEEAMVDLALQRLAHSTVKAEIHLSTPSIPDWGIDRLYQASDGRVWMIRCQSCTEWTCLEEVFAGVDLRGRELPRVLRPADGRIIRACRSCGREIFPDDGEWVARHPGRETVGWWISQLCSERVDPAAILRAYQTTVNIGEFCNSTLGVAWIEAENRLSMEEILALCGDLGLITADPGPCFMGVDQGKGLHVVIGRREPHKAGKIVHVGEYQEFEELDLLMKSFHVARCVIDAEPEMRHARAFAGRWPGRVFLCFYSSHQAGSYAWNERDQRVSVNRTESLDASHHEVLRGEIVLPRRSDRMEEFARQLTNAAKRLEEDEETGSKVYRYVKLGPDHYRHALNYECLARTHGAGGYLEGCDLS